MKIKNCFPTIVSNHIAGTVAEFEKIGFVQEHHLVDENKIDLYVMKADGGSKIYLMTPPAEGMSVANGFTVIVDDIDEAVAYFRANGFRGLTGILAAANTKACIMLWEGAGTTISVMQHVKD